MQIQEMEDEDHNTGVNTEGITDYIWLTYVDQLHLP